MTLKGRSVARRSIRRHQRVGLTVVALLVGGAGGWAATTDISGAVIAPGVLVVDSHVQKVQHPTGGVVGEIHARDGDSVQRGDVVVRLDDTVTKASLAIVTKRLTELRARKARLEAERDGAEAMEFPKDLVTEVNNKRVTQVFAGEERLFHLRKTSRTGQKAQLSQRIEQLDQEILGSRVQADAKAQELVLIKRELAGARRLWKKNLMPISKMTRLEREATRVAGEAGSLSSTIARSKARVAETELEIIQIDRDLASEVATELREIDAKIGEFVERKVTAEDELRRIELRAPQDGIVHQSVAHTVGGVISPGDPVMLIVPENDALKVEAKVAPADIDQLYVGQAAILRFSAFNQRTTPEIPGSLSRISADITNDDRTGLDFYTVRISMSGEEVARLGERVLVPGMPVEVFIKTEDRRVLSYLIKPIADQVERAFREQ